MLSNIFITCYDDIVNSSSIIYAVTDADTHIVFWLDIQRSSLCEYIVHYVCIYICTIYRNRNPKTSSWLVNHPPLINLPPTKNQALRMAYSPLVSINKALLNPPYVWRVRQVDYCSRSDCPPWYIHIAAKARLCLQGWSGAADVSWAKTKPNFALKK